MNNIWIVNDLLTCIPGTKTFWHLLLQIDNTSDKTGKPFSALVDAIEKDLDPCSLIIRNGTFFGWIKKDCKTISFIQDCYSNDSNQEACIKHSDLVVFNSKYTRDKYAPSSSMPLGRYCVIPIGVNEELFKPNGYSDIFSKKKKTGIFVGDYNTTKNTRMFESICAARPDLDFIYVSKVGNSVSLPNVKNVQGGVDEEGMVELYNGADFCIMCSPLETLHLTTVEAALCNIPVIGTNTGWLASHFSPKVGERIENCGKLDEYLISIDVLLKKIDDGFYEPRKYILENTPYTWSTCKKEWEVAINDVLNK